MKPVTVTIRVPHPKNISPWPLGLQWFVTVWWLGFAGALRRHRWGYGYGLIGQREFRVWLGAIVVRFPFIQERRKGRIA